MVEDRNVSVTVKNSGNVTGKEVVQLYVGFPEEAGEPPQMLKGFKKIELDPQQSTSVEFTLRDRDLSIWDVDTHDWKLISGDFTIWVGSSSRDIRATSTLTVNTA
jgi:beta-glucosidase